MPTQIARRARGLERKKALLRSKLRYSLAVLSPSEHRAKSKRIIKCLMGLPVFRKAANIALYASLPEEVDTRFLIDKALSLNKNVFLPRVNKKSGELELFQIRRSWRRLKKGAYGILEPPRNHAARARPEIMDLVIVPGLGFDKSGARLGRGKGYFDRFLKKAKRAAKVGLAFKEQLVRRIPANWRDVKVDKVITY